MNEFFKEKIYDNKFNNENIINNPAFPYEVKFNNFQKKENNIFRYLWVHKKENLELLVFMEKKNFIIVIIIFIIISIQLF